MKKTIVRFLISGMLVLGFWADLGKAFSNAGTWLYEKTGGIGVMM